jgi:hypothetical protein
MLGQKGCLTICFLVKMHFAEKIQKIEIKNVGGNNSIKMMDIFLYVSDTIKKTISPKL